MILMMSSIFWIFFQNLCTVENVFGLGFMFACHFLHLACSFDCEMMMVNPMNMKIDMHNLDSFLVILVYSLLFLHFWFVRYELIIGGVTMCVTPFLVHVADFIYHAIHLPIALNFCMMTLLFA